ncbi:Elongator subunit elp6 [Blastocladiella emersonii ATCC 22665]|nr:Elongator subunit elp6 [Blastocladiella emersonii ATCC 22665]
MFDLIQHLRINDHRHLAISHESTASAAFFLPLLTHAALATLHRPVILVSTQDVFLHYQQTCRKLGGNVQLGQLGRDRLLFVDALTQYHAVGTDERPRSSPDAARPTVVYLHSHPQVLANLYEIIAERVQGEFAGRAPVILLDDLMPFVYDAIDVRHVLLFVRKLVQLAESTGATLITQTQVDLGLDEAAQLAYGTVALANLVLVCKGLPSGYSRDVHGQLVVARGKASVATALHCGSAPSLLPDALQLQFKVVDKGVEFFGSGLSGAVV